MRVPQRSHVDRFFGNVRTPARLGHHGPQEEVVAVAPDLSGARLPAVDHVARRGGATRDALRAGADALGQDCPLGLRALRVRTAAGSDAERCEAGEGRAVGGGRRRVDGQGRAQLVEERCSRTGDTLGCARRRAERWGDRR